MDIQYRLNQLLTYGLKQGLFETSDYTYVANRLIHLLKLYSFQTCETDEEPITEVVNAIIDYAYHEGIIESDGVVHRDLFDSELMNLLMPRPSEVKRTFWAFYQENKQKATDYYYQLSQASNYIRMDRIEKNILWKTKTAYGELDITINLSKPEKDPKAIAMAKHLPKMTYPKCVLCRENEGYSGHLNHPGRGNHRLIELNLDHSSWFLQYSPYVYYNQHCIVLSKAHEPMKIQKATFKRLFEFVEQFPHYFLGSNADLPIVGGSILSHDHFQGGNYQFAMMKQDLRKHLIFKDYPQVEAGILNWPMSVIRLRSSNYHDLIELSDELLQFWRNYSDPSADIFAYTQEEPHNTMTPIARFIDEQYEMNLVLRNNRTTKEHPLGIFHPHHEHHHIKKENIGLIEVMGLAVLPARLETEMLGMKAYLLSQGKLSLNDEMKIHELWLNEILHRQHSIDETNVAAILKHEIAKVFEAILSQCGVFKTEQPFIKFVDAFNAQ